MSDDPPEQIRLAKAILSAETPEERREAVYAWAEHEIEQNRETYDKLANE